MQTLLSIPHVTTYHSPSFSVALILLFIVMLIIGVILMIKNKNIPRPFKNSSPADLVFVFIGGIAIVALFYIFILSGMS